MAESFPTKKAFDAAFPKKSKREALIDYEQIARQEIKTGDLIFFSGNHWMSSLIQWRSKSNWSHVGMVIWLEERLFLIESVIDHGGVRLIPLSYILKDYDGMNHHYNGRIAWARHIEMIPEKAEKVKNRALELMTKQYDSKEFLRVFWRTFIGRERLFPDHKFTCAEYVHECFLKAEIKLKYDKGMFISAGAFWKNKFIEMKGVIL